MKQFNFEYLDWAKFLYVQGKWKLPIIISYYEDIWEHEDKTSHSLSLIDFIVLPVLGDVNKPRNFP